MEIGNLAEVAHKILEARDVTEIADITGLDRATVARMKLGEVEITEPMAGKLLASFVSRLPRGIFAKPGTVVLTADERLNALEHYQILDDMRREGSRIMAEVMQQEVLPAIRYFFRVMIENAKSGNAEGCLG